jgi:hypothetical protein
MSQENVEIARRHHDAFNRRDIPAFLAALDPDQRLILGAG